MISVIIPVYNAEPYLRRCLNSVLSSTYREFELILVNDGSTDNSFEICQEYAAKDKRIQVISQENRGVSAARNRGLDICRGEWVVFVDADDVISPDFLGLIAQEEFQSQDLLLFDFARTEADLSAALPTLKALSFSQEQVPELLRNLIQRYQLVKGGNLNFVSPCAKAYRKELIKMHSIRFSSELFYGEDNLFNAEYLAQTERCAYLPVPVYFYNIHLDSSSHRFNPMLPLNLLILLEKLWGVLEDCRACDSMEKDFYSYVLENLSYTMVWTVFCPENSCPLREKLQFCHTLRENALYDKAITYNRVCGHWVRKTLVFLFQLRWYPAVGLLARVWYYYLNWKNRR